MGLDISGPNTHYHHSYAGLHYIRYMAYLYCGGERSYGAWMDLRMSGAFGERVYDWCTIIAHQQFPNLMFHSDCGGKYTIKGKCNPLDGRLESGNTRDLLRELVRLRRVAKRVKDGKVDGFSRHESYYSLLAVVRDSLKHGNGTLRLR